MDRDEEGGEVMRKKKRETYTKMGIKMRRNFMRNMETERKIMRIKEGEIKRQRYGWVFRRMCGKSEDLGKEEEEKHKFE